MKDSICKDFQQSVSELLIRHKSILDIMTKLEEAQARVNRAIAKAVTNCGCIKVNARKQIVPLDINIEDLKNHMSAHIEGELCENCRDIIEKEIGNHLFYIASLCNTLDISLDNVLEKEYENINTLGIYNMF
ncbi:MAG TPA: DUF1573 domain-containing protein [Clostridiales bacterium]|mgnify:CR=1 FL=1|nr:DUF1573 domain-containing protein [Clostridiales bacterium]